MTKGVMSREAAHAILDRVAEGADVPVPIIRSALEATGDLSGMPIRRYRPAGTWEQKSTGVLRTATPFDWLVHF